MQENLIVHNSYMREKRQLECIRRGDVEGIKQCYREPMCGPVGTLSKDPLRSRKNVGMCAMAIFARAAIDAGIIFDEAFAAGDSRAIKMDEAGSIEELDQYEWDMSIFFAQMVHDYLEETKKKQDRSHELVEECKKYIFQHLHEKMTVKQIAESLYVNLDYLSHLFAEREGITISGYIQGRRINQAKNLLMYSPYDCRSIANYLGYARQSHWENPHLKTTPPDIQLLNSTCFNNKNNRNMLFVAAYRKKTCYISSKSCFLFQINYRYASASVEVN